MVFRLNANVLAALIVACGPAIVSAQSGIDARVENTTLKIETSEKQAASAFQLNRVFPRLELPPIVSLRQHGQEFYAMAISGMLFKFPAVADPDPAEVAMVLNIQSLLGTTSADQGSYCVALDPNFHMNHKVYVNYASNVENKLTISRFTLGGSPTEAAATEEVLIRAQKPEGVLHYGGSLEFGPDGKFYISTGDGNDDITIPSQVPDSFLGKVLRIDVTSTPPEGKAYVVPSDNPFVNVAGYKPEIWALGLRNPYRFSFDVLTGRLFLGDPGENAMEEINIIRKGGNYGWPFMEGTLAHGDWHQADRVDLIPPIHTYGDTEPPRHAAIGGFVYRGTANPALVGRYVFADFVAGKLFALELVDNAVVSSIEVAGLGGEPIGAVHQDADGELYVTGFGSAGVFKLVPTGTEVSVNSQVQGLIGDGTVVDLNADGSGDSADVIEAQNGTKAHFFSRTN